MNIKIFLFSLVLILILTPYLFSKNQNQVVVILPFINTGEPNKDLDGTLFVSYFYFYIDQLRNFTVVYPYKILNFRAEKLHHTKDLYTLAVLNDILKEFNSDFILGGEFKVENEILKVNIDIFGTDKKLIIQREYKAKIKTDARDALVEIVIKTTKTFSQYNPDTTGLVADTDYPCTLCINGIVLGRTPGKFILPAGNYTIGLVYEYKIFKKSVFHKQVELEKDTIFDPGKIQVMVRLTVRANVKSEVFIDGTKIGDTDLSINIPVAHEYNIDVVYTDEHKEKRYRKEIITTNSMKDIHLEFLYPGRIKMVCGNFPFSGIVNNISGCEKLPFIFDNLEPGKFRVQIVLEDPGWKRNWIVHDEKILLHNTQTAVIDRSDFIYKKYWGLCFIPSAAQFYNFETGKGIVILTLSALSLAESITSYYIMKSNIDNVGVHNAFKTASWGGIAIFGSLYIYSCIDGIVTMDHLYRLFYPDH